MEDPLEDAAEQMERLQRCVAELTAANEGLKADLAERALAEDTLRDGEPDSRLILESIPALVVVLAPAGEVEHVNRQVVDYFGRTLDEMKNWRTNDSVHAEDRPDVIETLGRSIRTGQPYEVEHRLRRFDGEYLWFQARGLPLRDTGGRIARWYVLFTEIEGRKRAEEALRANEGALLEIINTLPVTAWSTLPDGYCDFLNQRWLEYAGFSVEQAKGWGWGAVIHPDDAPRLVSYWQACLASGAAVNVEARMRRADGTYRWFLFLANPLRDDAGNIVKWYGTNVDIEDRKRADEALRASEQDARLIVDCIPAQVAVLGPTGDVKQINRRMAEFFGKSAEGMSDWRTSDIVPAEERPRVVAAMAKSLETGEAFEMENRLRRFDGAYGWFQIRGLPLLDSNGQLVRWYFLIVDIEQRKQAEEALRRSQAVLAEAQRISSTGSFSWRLDTDELIFSEELRRIFEFEENSAVTVERVGLRTHPDDAVLLSRSMDQVRGSGGDFEYERRLRMPDGRIKHIRTFGKVIHHPDARRECIGAVQDVTQRHLSEEALDKARSELAHVTRSMSLGALTASIAHEVNQPLSGIVTNASTCVRLLTAEPPNVDAALETARRTIRDGNRAADVIARLRALFGKKAVATETVDLNDAAREVIALLSNDLQRGRVVLQAELDDDPLLVTGDRVQIQQVILNLVRNAADAMSGVNDRPRHLLIRTTRDERDLVHLTVQDVGIGLDPAAADRLFDAFYTTKSDSMGIGLSVSRSIVERHGGRLWAIPNEGPGATFAFSIPCRAEDVAASPNLMPPGAS